MTTIEILLTGVQQRTGLIALNLIAKLQLQTDWGVAKW
jgi:hypothetical protein